jgi:hypothetical protein
VEDDQIPIKAISRRKTFLEDGEVSFVAMDVGLALGYVELIRSMQTQPETLVFWPTLC